MKVAVLNYTGSVDKTVVAIEASSVSISRERHEVVVFTDDADKLPERVDRLGVKGLAHDIGGPIHETAEMTIDAHEAALELGNP